MAETAKANGHERYAYLLTVFTKLPAAKTLEDIEALLPFNLKTGAGNAPSVIINFAHSRTAFDPAILLKIILFAYSKGITTSRQIQWCCHSNIIFKALACDTSPDFTTIAVFVREYTKAIETLLEQGVLVCNEEGSIEHDLIMIDGCKPLSSVTKEWAIQ